MCTAISWPGSVHCFGRNLDLERSYGEVVAVTPRNYPLPLRNGETLRRHHAMIGAEDQCAPRINADVRRFMNGGDFDDHILQKAQ